MALLCGCGVRFSRLNVETQLSRPTDWLFAVPVAESASELFRHTGSIPNWRESRKFLPRTGVWVFWAGTINFPSPGPILTGVAPQSPPTREVALWAGVAAFFGSLLAIGVIDIFNPDDVVALLGACFVAAITAGSVYSHERLQAARASAESPAVDPPRDDTRGTES